jgi:hypothetical protein
MEGVIFVLTWKIACRFNSWWAEKSEGAGRRSSTVIGALNRGWSIAMGYVRGGKEVYLPLNLGCLSLVKKDVA